MPAKDKARGQDARDSWRSWLEVLAASCQSLDDGINFVMLTRRKTQVEVPLVPFGLQMFF